MSKTQGARQAHVSERVVSSRRNDSNPSAGRWISTAGTKNNVSHLCLWILEGNSCSYCERTNICCFVYLIRAGLLSQRRSTLAAAPLWGEPLCQQMVKLAEGKALCSPYWLSDIKACSMGAEYMQLKRHTLKQRAQGEQICSRNYTCGTEKRKLEHFVAIYLIAAGALVSANHKSLIKQNVKCI